MLTADGGVSTYGPSHGTAREGMRARLSLRRWYLIGQPRAALVSILREQEGPRGGMAAVRDRMLAAEHADSFPCVRALALALGLLAAGLLIILCVADGGKHGVRQGTVCHVSRVT